MTHILKVNPNTLNPKVAEELKKQKLVQPTDWSKFVKTGMHKERLPEDLDWWYARSAAMLRAIAKLGPVGTEKLRTKYGGRKRRGHKPAHRYKASGSIIRKILQQLEKSGLIKQTEKGAHRGRVLTPKGTSLIDKLAVQIAKEEHKISKE
ncbi:MAG: 30S ribosomal protein S19e [Nanoarchaeota archaeon]|nr:30S ribosomal protein S19e [Nanoarchaeota archaeon]MBU1644225.1 30S ribosomal protein S19e [Nanoarchaeota archaeon]MBU1976374.1 30S ribosomal protein S19e [Nanoarchaeota archaeon]